MKTRPSYIDRQQVKVEGHFNRIREIEETKGILFTLLPARIVPKEFVDIASGVVFQMVESCHQVEILSEIPEQAREHRRTLCIGRAVYEYYPKEWLDQRAPDPKKVERLLHRTECILRDQRRQEQAERGEEMAQEEIDQLIMEAEQRHNARKEYRKQEKLFKEQLKTKLV